MKIDMSKKYIISGVGLASLCSIIPADETGFQERILGDCVREVSPDPGPAPESSSDKTALPPTEPEEIGD